MKRIIVGLLALTLAAFSGQAAKADRFEDILKKGVVRIAVPLDVPPFGSQNQAREAEGFDVELAGMVISVMGLTPERAKQIMFTSPYADTKLAVFGPKSADVPSADKIGSLKVAAAKGTTQELALSAMAPKATIMRTEDDATAAAAYVSGQAELFATNTLIIPDLQKRNPAKEFELKFTIRRSPAHMGVRMGEHTLVRWLDSFVFFNVMNGEIDRLHKKYLGIPLAPLPSL